MSEPHPPRMSRGHLRRVIAIIVISQLVLAAITGVTVYAAFHHFDHNIRAGGEIPGHHRHAGGDFSGPLNILVMGNDTRNCNGCHIDNETGAAGSDTTILVHVYADHKSAVGISIPRDLLVKPIPCTQNSPEYKTTGLRLWNEAFTGDHPECTAAQVQATFGVPVDDYVAINFGGFKDMVDALGGVQVCLPKPVDDNFAHIHLPAGTQTLHGTDALGYVRERHAIGDGSDIGRMKRQQAFIASMANKLLSAGTFSRPDHLLRFANALTSALETNPEIASAADLVNLGLSIRHANLSHIKFLTVPSEPYPVPESNPYWGRIKLLPAAKTLWDRIRNDQPIGKLGQGAISANKPQGNKSNGAGNAAAGLCG